MRERLALQLIFIAIFAVTLLSSTANAARISNWNIDISLNENKIADWFVTIDYQENVDKSDYFVLAEATNIEVFADSLPIECSVSKKLGTTILCENIDAKKIVYKFKTLDLITNMQDLFIFKYRFSVTQLTDKFSLVVRLPFGTAVVEKGRIEGTGLRRFEPPWGREGSDGRIIYLEWIENDPKLGETFDASAVYEDIIVIDQSMMIYVIGLIALVIIISIIYFVKFRRNIEDIFPLLTENERKVMEIIHKDKIVDQRRIVKDTDFSKAKVSRVIHDLIKRGLIEKKQKGRTNIIKLKRGGIVNKIRNELKEKEK